MSCINDIKGAREEMMNFRNQTRDTRPTSFAYHNSDTILHSLCLFEHFRATLESFNRILRNEYSRGLPLTQGIEGDLSKFDRLE
jgi:hypothetical protein